MFSKKLSYNFSNVLNPKKKVGDNLSNKKEKKKEKDEVNEKYKNIITKIRRCISSIIWRGGK